MTDPQGKGHPTRASDRTKEHVVPDWWWQRVDEGESQWDIGERVLSQIGHAVTIPLCHACNEAMNKSCETKVSVMFETQDFSDRRTMARWLLWILAKAPSLSVKKGILSPESYERETYGARFLATIRADVLEGREVDYEVVTLCFVPSSSARSFFSWVSDACFVISENGYSVIGIVDGGAARKAARQAEDAFATIPLHNIQVFDLAASLDGYASRSSVRLVRPHQYTNFMRINECPLACLGIHKNIHRTRECTLDQLMPSLVVIHAAGIQSTIVDNSSRVLSFPGGLLDTRYEDFEKKAGDIQIGIPGQGGGSGVTGSSFLWGSEPRLAMRACKKEWSRIRAGLVATKIPSGNELLLAVLKGNFEAAAQMEREPFCVTGWHDRAFPRSNGLGYRLVLQGKGAEDVVLVMTTAAI